MLSGFAFNSRAQYSLLTTADTPDIRFEHVVEHVLLPVGSMFDSKIRFILTNSSAVHLGSKDVLQLKLGCTLLNTSSKVTLDDIDRTQNQDRTLQPELSKFVVVELVSHYHGCSTKRLLQ